MSVTKVPAARLVPAPPVDEATSLSRRTQIRRPRVYLPASGTSRDPSRSSMTSLCAVATVSRKDLVVIGGSAGSVPAVLDVLTGLGRGLHGCVCITLHLAPSSPEWLSTRFARATGLTVRSPEEDLPLQRGTIYIAKPDHHLIVKRGCPLGSRSTRELLAARDRRSVPQRCSCVRQPHGGCVDERRAGRWHGRPPGNQSVRRDRHRAGPRGSRPPRNAAHRIGERRHRSSRPGGEIAGLLRKLAGETAGATPEIPQSLRREVLYAEAVSPARRSRRHPIGSSTGRCGLRSACSSNASTSRGC